MGLSERDHRLLDEMERDLVISDGPSFLQFGRRPAHIGRAAASGAVFLLGVGALVGGVVVAGAMLVVGAIISVVGFVLMLGPVWRLCNSRSWDIWARPPRGGPSSGPTN